MGRHHQEGRSFLGPHTAKGRNSIDGDDDEPLYGGEDDVRDPDS